MPGNVKTICFLYSGDPDDMNLYKDLAPFFIRYQKKGLLQLIDREAVFQRHADMQFLGQYVTSADLTIPLISVDLINSEECMAWFQQAVGLRRPIFPVLWRPCDWTTEDVFKPYLTQVFPRGGVSVLEAADDAGEKEKLFTQIAVQVKKAIFPELETVEVRSGVNKPFFYLIAALLLLMGILAGGFVYVKLNMGLGAALFAFLMFACIALFTLRNVFFPAQLKIA